VNVDGFVNVSSTYVPSQNYQNPFNPATKISYSVSNVQFVTLKIYDIFGREVSTLVSGLQQSGTSTLTWDAGRQASGGYSYRLKAGDLIMTK
jgi:flagellar hook assembly protein FlgD